MPQTIAVLNSNEDVIELLRTILEEAGFNTVSTHVPDIKRGHEDFIAFLEKHDPAAIVYDIAPPYQENWNFLKLILDAASVKTRKFIITTANERLLREVAGADIAVCEISEKPYSMEAILKAVKQSLKSA
jgi:DNA-binding NtrC family response regulator